MRVGGKRTLHSSWCLMIAVVIGALVTLMAGCSSPAEPEPTNAPHPLTMEQAERLAMFRFNAYQDGMRAVQGTVVGQESITIRGWIDSAGGRGYALITPQATQPGAFLSQWDAEQVSAQGSTATVAPLPPPTEGWESIALDPGASILAAAQALLVSLSADRPENAQLLLQSSAEWLAAGTVDGTPVDIMSGPVMADSGATQSSFRYWIDADGNLLRVEALLDGVHMSTFDFAPAPEVTF